MPSPTMPVAPVTTATLPCSAMATAQAAPDWERRGGAQERRAGGVGFCGWQERPRRRLRDRFVQKVERELDVNAGSAAIGFQRNTFSRTSETCLAVLMCRAHVGEPSTEATRSPRSEELTLE